MTDPISTKYIIIFLAAILWAGVWKLIALWRAGRNKQKAWFIFLAIFNTLGVLPIIYLWKGQKDKNETTGKV